MGYAQVAHEVLWSPERYVTFQASVRSTLHASILAFGLADSGRSAEAVARVRSGWVSLPGDWVGPLLELRPVHPVELALLVVALDELVQIHGIPSLSAGSLPPYGLSVRHAVAPAKVAAKILLH